MLKGLLQPICFFSSWNPLPPSNFTVYLILIQTITWSSIVLLQTTLLLLVIIFFNEGLSPLFPSAKFYCLSNFIANNYLDIINFKAEHSTSPACDNLM